MITLPLSTGDASDVQAEVGEGGDDDHAGRDIDPLAKDGREDHCEGSRAEVERKFDSDARRYDVCRAADGEDDALQRASFRWGRVLPPPQTPKRSAFQRGWVGGRSEATS